MKNHLFASSVTLIAGTMFVTASCDQPPVLCTTGRGDFAATYTLIEGGAECSDLKSERLGMNAYTVEKDGPNSGSMADWGRSSVAIGSERIGWLVARAAQSMVKDPNEAHKIYAVGDFPQYPTDDFCAVPTMKTADAEIDMPAVPAILDDPMTDKDEGQPAIDPTHYKYAWSNVRFLVTPSALGTQMTADLEFTRNSCTARYKVKAVYPARACESATTPGTPDLDLCSPEAKPEKGIYVGSGISPDFPVDCVEFDPEFPGRPKRFYCMITKDVPAFR
jgi:hypothetical protein